MMSDVQAAHCKKKKKLVTGAKFKNSEHISKPAGCWKQNHLPLMADYIDIFQVHSRNTPVTVWQWRDCGTWKLPEVAGQTNQADVLFPTCHAQPLERYFPSVVVCMLMCFLCFSCWFNQLPQAGKWIKNKGLGSSQFRVLGGPRLLPGTLCRLTR